MIRYSFKDQPLTIKSAKKASAQKIGEMLARLAETGDGELRPKAVVDAARAPNSPLHKHFEWDDNKAAEAFRLEQAREIIRVVRVKIDDAEPMRAFLSVSDKHTSYRTAQEVQGSIGLQALVLQQAERDLASWEKRYAELGSLCDDVKAVRQKIADRRAASEARAN